MGGPDARVERDARETFLPPPAPVPPSPTFGTPCGTDSSRANASVGDLEEVQTTSNDVDVATPSPSDWTSGNLCLYDPPRSDGCTEPRSCRDCLNVDVHASYSCLVNQYGRCVQKTPSTYVKALDFRYQNASNDGHQGVRQQVQFLADEVDYCHLNDSRCQECRATMFKDVMEGDINDSLTKFCYGDDGCVCIAVCEAPVWKTTIGLTICNGSVVETDFKQHQYGATTEQDGREGFSLVNVLMGVVGGVAATLLAIAVAIHVHKRRTNASGSSGSSGTNSSNEQSSSTQENGTGDGSVPRREPVAPTLNLFGWQSMQSELIEREQLLLAGIEDFSGVRTGYLQLLDVDASAPPSEEDESSAPVLLVPLAGASAPSLSPSSLATASRAAPTAPPASPSLLEEELL